MKVTLSNGRWFLGVLITFLTLVGIGASISYFINEPYNPGFREFPLITAFHVIFGAIYLGFAPLQLVRPIRSRWPGYHRWMGRFLVSIGLIVGVTALFMALVIPISGWWERIIVGFFSGLFLIALSKGLLSIRAKQVPLHREWMIRAFAIGLGIATMRMFFISAMNIIDADRQQVGILSILCFTLAFSLHSGFAELWIRTHRSKIE